MTKKLIACSFDNESIGGFITVNNGVGWGKNGHISRTVAVTREAFLEACKDKLLFNKILGINIADGWQNALSDAISNFKGLTTDKFDPQTVAKTIIETDIKVRGEEAVAKDMEPIITADEALTKELEEIVKKEPKAKKGKKNGGTNKGTKTGTSAIGEVAGDAESPAVSDGQESTDDNVRAE